MGCLKLRYYSGNGVLGKNPKVVKGNVALTQKSALNYYPFGMQMPSRNHNPGEYRFGYQGSESDNEISGSGNSYIAYFRQLDVRLGRWWSVDPLMANTPYQSPYVSMDNNPIFFLDPNGAFSTHTNEDGEVVAVYKDDDNSVYKHNDLPENFATTENDDGERLKGGKKVGETVYWDEFRVHANTGGILDKVVGKIYFGVSIDGIITNINNQVKDDFKDKYGIAYLEALKKLKIESNKYGDYDIKNNEQAKSELGINDPHDGVLLS